MESGGGFEVVQVNGNAPDRSPALERNGKGKALATIGNINGVAGVRLEIPITHG